MRAFLVILLCCAVVASAQQKKGDQKKQARDLKYETLDDKIDAPATSVSVPRSYALVVGVSAYPKLESKMQLKFPDRDADAVYSVLISREGGNFPAENVRKLTGSKATLANIKDALETWLPSVTKDDDRVVVYFAGHGFVYSGKVYLAPQDFDPKNPTGSGYSTDALGAAFGAKIKGKWKVLLTDSCHSGAVTSDTDVRTINSRLLDLNKSLFSLTASRDREQSFEGPDFGGGHGVFTYYVVKGLEGEADESRDAIVSADELAAYVQRNVREASGGRQNPTVGGSFDNAMLLAYLPTKVPRGAPPAPKFGTLIFESNMDGVEVFVDGKTAGVVDKGKTLSLPGLTPGAHQVKAVRMGYEPVTREEMVYPGQEATVTLRITIPRKRPKAALEKFDDAVDRYQKANSPDDYRRAVRDFEAVLALDQTYSEAALYAARANRDLNEYDAATKYFKRALELDPDFIDARVTFGGMLYDIGDTDEAIRHLNAALNRDKKHPVANYLLAQAYRLKEAYAQGIEAGETAVAVAPQNGEAHFWLAENYRMGKRWQEAIREYNRYLELTNYESSGVRKAAWLMVGFGPFLKKKRGSTTDVWRELRGMAYFGLCECEQKQHRPEKAIAYCERALSFKKDDPQTYWVLGLSYMHQARNSGQMSYLPAAKQQFETMLRINPDLDESTMAKGNIIQIDKVLQAR